VQSCTVLYKIPYQKVSCTTMIGYGGAAAVCADLQHFRSRGPGVKAESSAMNGVQLAVSNPTLAYHHLKDGCGARPG